ncbi:glycosyltransferase [Rathayibacter toxicus]|uniref:D-inositol 3-phosphate glycosyltransferase n=1 Tax=Rathayibacter toxicus TaxID=145458 RepID=A0A2S5Y5H3_9MICO|nr:glycosyltransferase [Rathayibacter toxicus]PPH21835.1 glycosyltransferase family 1 protein [Rathayibacter toxicus]PPH56265.1 glycosyltransferase family 1 protein [Rathayibacter toxicus]PPH58361.1 glycosyltransferase family 1 protein [Rathayibacter toxicus]PPH86108.1 glycosyltransferase family 1 protein [Rathayibacter toxicus]PPI13993.1 glycosyltransferase family 1 protein [Rathayibacter toxicus]
MPRLSVISAHTSPLDQPSTGEAGGMNVYLAAILPELAMLGWEITVLTRGEGTRTLAPGVDVMGVPAPGDTKYALAASAPHFAQAASGADLVHSHYWVSGLAGALTGLPHVHSMHSNSVAKNRRLLPDDQAEPPERMSAERSVLASADAIVVAGSTERDDVVHGYAVAPERVVTVPPGVSSIFHPGDGARAHEIVLVGRILPLKGQLLAVRALALIPPEERPVLRLLGGPAPGQEGYLEQVREAAAELGEGVRLEGVADRDHTARRLRCARLALVPSAAETFGLVALEAAASGTPVLARRTTGLVDAVRDGQTGVLIDSGEPEVWAARIRLLLADPHEQARLGRGGVVWAARHSWRTAAEQLDHLYRTLLAGAEAPL